MDVHVRDLRAFVVVAREGQVTRAAEQLHVSQPALSKQIRALEHRLGTRLFARTAQGVVTTPVGATLLSHAEGVIAAWDDAARAVERAKSEQASRLVVGMSTGLGRGLLPAVRSRFSTARPDAEVVLRAVGWGDPTGGLDGRTTDVAYVWLPLPSATTWTWIPVATEPCHVALPASHPLARRDTVTITDLLDEPFLALPPGAGAVRDRWLAVDARGGRPPRIGAEVASLDETYEALLDGRGVCLLAAGNAPLVARDGVVTRPVPDVPPSELVLAWRRDDTRPLVAAYARACHEVVAARR